MLTSVPKWLKLMPEIIKMPIFVTQFNFKVSGHSAFLKMPSRVLCQAECMVDGSVHCHPALAEPCMIFKDEAKVDLGFAYMYPYLCMSKGKPHHNTEGQDEALQLEICCSIDL
jgi:hypothetical protein